MELFEGTFSPQRYETMTYRRAGRSGLKLPLVSLGLWHNFGDNDSEDNAREMVCTAFANGITHFDLANNYGPPPGSAETCFGRILKQDLNEHRDELIISTKAGYRMWDGPYGEWGSRKNLLSSLDQSLMRMGLDYVDIFYSHRFDPETPLEETIGALASAVQGGKALYVGISNYPQEATREALSILKRMGVPCLLHQVRYNMFGLAPVEDGLLDILEEGGSGCISFSPLAQGLLTNRYLQGIPDDSRISKSGTFLKSSALDEPTLKAIGELDLIAKKRNQSLSQMALAWNLRHPVMTSVLIGASRPAQILDNIKAMDHLDFSNEELKLIESICRRRREAQQP
jgi:L-glyceraldehyde 3-phosphate reductase